MTRPISLPRSSTRSSTISNTARLIGSPGQDGSGAESIDWNRETLRVAELSPLPPEALRDGLRIWLQGRRGALRGIGSVHIESIIKLIKSEKSGRMVEMPGKATVVKQKGRIRFTK
ncbi:MAG: TilS substrate-binding domain-containing protein [Acidobacteriota bacterium]